MLFRHPVISLVDTTVETIRRQGLHTVGLLASPTTIQSKLYETALARIGTVCLLPTKAEQHEVELLIRSVIAGKKPATKRLLRIAHRLRRAGAEKVLLGCTELSVLMADHAAGEFIDPLCVITDVLFNGEELAGAAGSVL